MPQLHDPGFMNPPAITIVTPSYNQGSTLEATIRSVADQQYPGLQYVVMDGGSTDGSVDLIRRHEGQLQHWASGPDDGHYAAINEGFAKTDAEIMGWLNSDDLHLPWTLSVVGEIFARFPQVAWITSLFPLRFDEAGRAVYCRKLTGFSRHGFRSTEYAPGQPGAAWPVQQESTFWRRSLWEQAGGLDAAISHAADFDLWMRFSRISELVGVETPLAGFRRSQSGQRSIQEKSLYDSQVRESLQRHGGSVAPAPVRFLRSIMRQHGSIRLLSPLRWLGLAFPVKICRRRRDNSDWELLTDWA